MSYCGKCGTQMEEHETVCPQCGAAVEQTNEGKSEMAQNIVAKLKDPKNRKPLGIALIAIIVMIVIISVAMSGKKTINLEEMVSVEYSGYDGYGTASASINYDQYTEALQKVLGNKYPDMDDFDWDDEEGGSKSLSYAFQLEEVYESIELSLDKEDGISNEDEITVTISYDQDAAKEAGIKLKGDSVKITVEGLEEIEEYNPFDDLDVSFDGVSPNATVELNYTGSKNLNSYDFEVSKSSGIAEGDVITISVDLTEEDTTGNGYILSETSKEYTAKELSKYVSSVSELTEEKAAILISDANDVVEAYFADITDYVSIGKTSYEGAYVLNSKENNSWGYDNYVYIVLKAQVKSKEGGFKKQNVYFPIEFTDAVVANDGTISYQNVGSGILGTTNLEYDLDGWWSNNLDGYTKVSKMYNELVSKNKVNYTIDFSENLK